MTTTMPPAAPAAADAGLMPRLRMLAAASREATEIDWQREAADRDQAQRVAAVARAHEEVEERFPATLALILNGEGEPEDRFKGYPNVYEAGAPAGYIPGCAVAYLGEGLWLRHSTVDPIDPFLPPSPSASWPTLLVPCSCGRYREVAIEDDYSLAQALDRVDATRTVCLGDCSPGSSQTNNDDQEVPF